ncbi:hypothetical protein ACTD5D_29745 [Nocardia takedensis]|nr:hypothetical protein [Nocardia takedensis]
MTEMSWPTVFSLVRADFGKSSDRETVLPAQISGRCATWKITARGRADR